MAAESDPVEVNELNGLQEGDFQRWKHHPVTVLYVAYLRDYADQIRRAQIQNLEHAVEPMPPLMQGELKGRINTLMELAAIEFTHLLEFYPPLEATEEGTDAA